MPLLQEFWSWFAQHAIATLIAAWVSFTPTNWVNVCPFLDKKIIYQLLALAVSGPLQREVTQ